MDIIPHNVSNIAVGQRKKDGYINATALTTAYKKATGKKRDVSDWFQNKRTQESLKHLSCNTGIPVFELYQVFQGSPDNGGGTWLHPKLSVRFAIWLSDDFGYQVESWVETWMTTGQVTLDRCDEPQSRPVLGAYIERVKSLHDNSHNIPDGYWSVLSEASLLLVYVESVLQMPVDKSDLLDGSIGSHWANYRKGKNWAFDRVQYTYQFPNGQTCHPWCYKWKELPHFKSWLESVYKKSLMPSYLLKKYGAMIQVQELKLRSIA
ncbi:KilA-N domain-containing protein [Microcoleus sp. herbarium14]|uniref:KilA-N domain-containing protein n=1 Tax=Microcoleus sp. herbarium14 TaxID=3055439 RepID=UPI002FD77F2E